MPSNKKTNKPKEQNSFDLQNLVNGSDSYKSLIYGIVTVVVLFVVIALGIRTLQQNKAQIDDEAMSTQKVDITATRSKYTVSEGDTLWSIAEKSYNDGFKWNEIAKANNITDSTSLTKGMQLTIPEIASAPVVSQIPTIAISPTIAVSPTLSLAPTEEPKMTNEQSQTMPGEKITGETYKVVDGDTLWDISVRAYGTGYKWVEIAKLNNLQNPDLIYPSNTLKLPQL